MGTKEIMRIVKETFNDEINPSLHYFLEDPYALIEGKEDFFSKLELKLKN